MGETSVFAVLSCCALSIFQRADNPHSAQSSYSFLEVAEMILGEVRNHKLKRKHNHKVTLETCPQFCSFVYSLSICIV